MKSIKPKRSIYLRTFAWLLGIWLVLMLGFSAYLLSGAKKSVKSTFVQEASSIITGLTGYPGENDENRRLLAALSSLSNRTFSTAAFRYAVYSQEYNLIYDSGDSWICAYNIPNGMNSWKVAYGCFSPKKWFSDKEVADIIQYLIDQGDPKKPGDLCGYTVSLDGWVDGQEFIPEIIRAIPMYAKVFDDKGNVAAASSAFSEASAEYEIKSRYASLNVDTTGLPYYERGYIQSGYSAAYIQAQNDMINASVTDQEKLKDTADNYTKHLTDGTFLQAEKIGIFTDRYYLVMPYQNAIKFNGDIPTSAYWIALSGESNYFSGALSTLLIVWLVCLGVFTGTAWMMSSQTWKTYRRREELEQQRIDTTNAIAHDLKTPLAAISGYAENLAHNVHTEKREHYAARIQENVQRMDQIVKEMLGLSQLESGTQKLNLQEMLLLEETKAVVYEYEDAFAEKIIRLSIAGEAKITADRSLISRVIHNFISNAALNTSHGGMIAIAMDEHRWSITNTGIQIPEDQLKAIWQAYYKTDAARSNPKGSGLGLAIVQSILDLHGFKYGVENTSTGVRFWFGF